MHIVPDIKCSIGTYREAARPKGGAHKDPGRACKAVSEHYVVARCLPVANGWKTTL